MYSETALLRFLQIQQLVQDDPFRQQLDNLLHKKAAYGASTAKKRDQVKFKTLKSKIRNLRNPVGISYIRLLEENPVFARDYSLARILKSSPVQTLGITPFPAGNGIPSPKNGKNLPLPWHDCADRANCATLIQI